MAETEDCPQLVCGASHVPTTRSCKVAARFLLARGLLYGSCTAFGCGGVSDNMRLVVIVVAVVTVVAVAVLWWWWSPWWYRYILICTMHNHAEI